jgi:hypothetical protein
MVSEEKRPFVGHSVHGVVDGCFVSGYLVTVRIRDTNIVYRGVVFGPGVSVPVENNRDMTNYRAGLNSQVSKDEGDEEEDLAREDGLNLEEQHVMEKEDEGDKDEEWEGEGEGEEASGSPPTEVASDCRVYQNLLQAQMQTQGQRQMSMQNAQVHSPTTSGSASELLAISASLSSMGSGSATTFPNANYAYANAIGLANANPNVGHADSHARVINANAQAVGHVSSYANASSNVNASHTPANTLNLNPSSFAPETAYQAPPSEREMLKLMYPGSFEPQVHPNHPLMSNVSSISTGIYRQAPYPMPSGPTHHYSTPPGVTLNPHPPHPTSDS